MWLSLFTVFSRGKAAAPFLPLNTVQLVTAQHSSGNAAMGMVLLFCCPYKLLSPHLTWKQLHGGSYFCKGQLMKALGNSVEKIMFFAVFHLETHSSSALCNTRAPPLLSTPPSGHLTKIFYCSSLSLKSSCLFRFVVSLWSVSDNPLALTRKKKKKKKGILN